jgi:hypothetical protein
MMRGSSVYILSAEFSIYYLLAAGLFDESDNYKNDQYNDNCSNYSGPYTSFKDAFNYSASSG